MARGGNVLAIAAVKSTRKLQTVSNYFVVNLSLCDLLFVCGVLPFNIYTYISDGWYLDPVLCKLVAFLGYTLTGTTIITITLIAYNRYKLILDFHSYKRVFKKENVSLMIFMSWILPMVLLFPPLIEVWGEFGYVAMLVNCNLLLRHDSQLVKLFLLIVRAGIPCVLILYYYGKIWFTIKRNHQRIHKSLSALSILEQNNRKKELHLTKMMTVIFVVFAVSYFPCTITGLIDWHNVLSKQFHMYCAITVYIGSAMNPLIYGMMNSQFRSAYSKLLCCCLETSLKQSSSARTISEKPKKSETNLRSRYLFLRSSTRNVVMVQSSKSASECMYYSRETPGTYEGSSALIKETNEGDVINEEDSSLVRDTCEGDDPSKRACKVTWTLE